MKSKITIFLLKLFILYILWFIITEILNDTRFWHAVNSVFLREVLFLSKWSLIIIGKFLKFSVQTIPLNGLAWAPHDTLIFYKGDITYRNFGELFIDNRCLALDLMYTFSVFIIAFYGPWKKKILFILFGIFIINTLNIFRIVGLALTEMFYPQYMDFNHHILFTYIVYFFTFILWVVWIKRYAKDELIKIVEDMKDKDKQKKLIQS
jgi:exosortase/archaeosortase family protein